MTIRKISCLLLLGAAACVHQPRVLQEPKIELRQLCNDATTRSFCTPAQSDDQLVDTNLAAPPSHDILLAG